MPIYEYQCPQCEAIFEEWLSVSDATDIAACPHCGTDSPHIISNTAFVLKGGGWYVTDYGNRKNESKESVSSSGDAGLSPASAPPAADASAPKAESSAPATPSAPTPPAA